MTSDWLAEAMATGDIERVKANMAANGLRARGSRDAHRITLDYARNQLAGVITGSDIDEADEIRKDRALAEYGDFASRQLTGDHVQAAAEVAERIVNAIANALASRRS